MPKFLSALVIAMTMVGAGCLNNSSALHVPRPASTEGLGRDGAKVVTADEVKLVVGNSTTTVAFKDGMSVYDAMKSASDTRGFQFDGKDYGGDMGYFVTSINGKAGDAEKNLYWVFYVDGIKAQTGVSQTEINANDIITWKYEPLEF